MTLLLAHLDGSAHLHLRDSVSALVFIFALGLLALAATNNSTKGK